MKPSKKELEAFSKKYGKFACREITDEYLQLTFKYNNLKLRYYYESENNIK